MTAPENTQDASMTVKQAAAFLGVTETTLRNWDRTGKVRAERHPVNRYRLYRRADLENLRCTTRTSSVGQNQALIEGNVLLIEDDPRDIHLITHAITKATSAVKVRSFRDGASASAYLQGLANRQSAFIDPEFPKLILLDLRLPGEDGLAVLKKLKQDPRTQTIPLVVLSASDYESEIAECYRLGASGFTSKEIDYDKFEKNIINLVYYWFGINRLPDPVADKF